jgi:hypothetical protein
VRNTGGSIILVECGLDPTIDWTGLDNPAQVGCAAIVARIDHHRPGDPGYGKPPAEFLAASSIGQALTLLNGRVRYTKYDQWISGHDGCPASSIPTAIVLAAAADHCLEAAYRGLCPGVDPDALMQFRAEQRAAFRKAPVDQVLAEIETARARLRASNAHVYEDDGDGIIGTYADLRGESIPELPEAACREGIPFLADQNDRNGRKKVVLMAAPQGSDLVQRFMAGEIVPGLTDYYGDPARGFAGGYLPAAM